MKTTKIHDERIANMIFGSVYPMYVSKVESKGRTQEELHQDKLADELAKGRKMEKILRGS